MWHGRALQRRRRSAATARMSSWRTREELALQARCWFSAVKAPEAANTQTRTDELAVYSGELVTRADGCHQSLSNLPCIAVTVHHRLQGLNNWLIADMAGSMFCNAQWLRGGYPQTDRLLASNTLSASTPPKPDEPEPKRQHKPSVVRKIFGRSADLRPCKCSWVDQEKVCNPLGLKAFCLWRNSRRIHFDTSEFFAGNVKTELLRD